MPDHSERLPRSYYPGPADRPTYVDLPSAPQDNGDLAAVLRALWRRKWLILLITLALTAAAVLAVSQMPSRYTAVVHVRVGVAMTQMAKIDPVVAGRSFDNQLAVMTEAYVLQSREVADRVVKRLALDRDPEFNRALRTEKSWLSWLNISQYVPRPSRKRGSEQTGEDAYDGVDPAEMQRQAIIDALLSKVEVVPLGRSHVLGLTVESENPVTAARVANALAEAHIEEQLISKAKSTERASQWLEEQIGRLRGELDVAERSVEEYRRDHGLYESRQATVSSQQLSELNTQLILAQAQKAEADARLHQAESLARTAEGRETAPAVLSSPLIQALKQKEAEIAQSAALLESRYGAKHPKMANNLAELRDIRQKIRQEIGKVIDGLRNESKAAGARYTALANSLETLKGKVGISNEASIKLRALERNAQASRTLFENFLQRSKETDAQLDMQQSDAKIISRAAVPESPSFPPVNVIIFIALFGGLVIGAIVVLVLERIDRTFRSAEDVEEATGLPTLTLVPKVNPREFTEKRILETASSPYVEAIRKLLLGVTNDRAAASGRTVMVTSAVPNEGKTGVCLSMARLAALGGSRVIVLDADWRRARLHFDVGQQNKVGLAELLAGEARPADVVYRDASGAHFVFAGRPHRSHTRHLFSARTVDLLESLGRHYDLVLVDTPPVLTGADVLHLARCVDTTLYMIQWGRTPRDVALRGLQELSTRASNISGVVLTQVGTKSYREYGYGAMDYSRVKTRLNESA
jgi:uncharacterized protein involved in exopolysaccharide biosynthesis/Mrp family chromosome partitioning ATPase